MKKLTFNQKTNLRIALLFLFLIIVAMCATSCSTQQIQTKAQSDFHHNELMNASKVYYVVWCTPYEITFSKVPINSINEKTKTYTIRNAENIMVSPGDIMECLFY